MIATNEQIKEMEKQTTVKQTKFTINAETLKEIKFINENENDKKQNQTVERRAILYFLHKIFK